MRPARQPASWAASWPYARTIAFAFLLALASGACSHAPGPGTAREAAPEAAPTPSDRAPALGDAFARIDQARRDGRPALAIFDIDGTVLDPAARTRDILALALEGPEAAIRPSRPDLAQAMRALPLARHGYEAESTLTRIGVTDTASVRALKARWNRDFFTNQFLLRDEALPGAVAYLDSLHARGATLVYFTGRDAPRMLSGTAQSLLLRGFPIGVVRTMLVMKPDKSQPDFDYKKAALDELAAFGTVVAVFENEPRNINLLHERFPRALAFYLDTKHSANAPAVEPGIAWIKDFAGFRSR